MTKEEFESIGWVFERSEFNPKFIEGNWHHDEKVETEWIFTRQVYQIGLVLKFFILRNEVNIYSRYPEDNWYFTGMVVNLSDLKVIDRCIVTMLLFDLNAVKTKN